MKCGGCTFFVGDLCRRYPKVYVKSASDFCGEFKPIVVPVVFACTCGKEFQSIHSLRVHVGKIGSPKHKER